MSISPFVPSKLAEKILQKRGLRLGGVLDDIPLLRTITGKLRYPLQDMQIGQHFFVPHRGRTVIQTQNAVSSSVCHAQRVTGRKFHQRRYVEGVRVWRIW